MPSSVCQIIGPHRQRTHRGNLNHFIKISETIAEYNIRIASWSTANEISIDRG